MELGWQHTLSQEVTFQGPTLHSGEKAEIYCRPAPPDTGVVFLVRDGGDRVPIKASVSNVIRTQRCTTLGLKGVEVGTVEHILAAIRGMELDNLFIEVEGPEIPIGDGSASLFAELFYEAGLKEQRVRRRYWSLQEIFKVERDRETLILKPAPSLTISYTFVTDHPLIGVQYASFTLDRETFLQEIAPAKTFGFLKEVEALQSRGLIKGGSLENALLIGEEEIIGEPHFSNELARHKILDIIGDMALTLPFTGHIKALGSGHSLNVELVKKIESSSRRREIHV